jgi:hypothetical protein
MSRKAVAATKMTPHLPNWVRKVSSWIFVIANVEGSSCVKSLPSIFLTLNNPIIKAIYNAFTEAKYWHARL